MPIFYWIKYSLINSRNWICHLLVNMAPVTGEDRLLLPPNWLPNSPDLNPLNYSIRSALQQLVYRQKIKTTDHLYQVLHSCWDMISQDLINAAVDLLLSFSGWTPGLPWIWISMDISMDISMCGYQTWVMLWIYPWIFDINILIVNITNSI